MILIKHGLLIDPKRGEVIRADMLIKDGVIAKIAETIDEQADTIIDAKGKYVGPGLVDVHVHFRDPGFTHKEDIETGAKAAAAGGVTTVVLMANTSPAVDNVDTLRYVLDKGAKTDIRVETCGNITVGLKGKELTDMEALLEAGAAGFTDDGIPILDEMMVRRAMEQAAALSAKMGKPIPLSFHEENPAFIENNGINRGKASAHFGIGGSDRQAEISMIARDLQLALETGASFDVQHISTKEGVALVREAKKKGANIHAEATPHHIFLTEEAAIAHGTLAKMNPPLRTQEDQDAIIEGLFDGTIDMIATDHAPHAANEKALEITKAPSGIIGLETSLPICITKLYREKQMSLPMLFDRLSYGPARLYGFDRGYIAEGAAADLVIFDPDAQVTFTEFASKSQNSPFSGTLLYGKISHTICRGNVIYGQ